MFKSCWLFFFVVLLGINELQGADADVIVVNAKVYSLTGGFQESIAIKANMILAVGEQVEIEKLAGKSTRRIDVGGAAVTPGFNDAHVHLFSGSESLQQVDLLDASSLEDIGNRIRSFATANPKKAVVVGRGWLRPQKAREAGHQWASDSAKRSMLTT